MMIGRRMPYGRLPQFPVKPQACPFFLLRVQIGETAPDFWYHVAMEDNSKRGLVILFALAALAVIVLGIGLGLVRGFNLGIDFTGGSMLQLDLGKKVEMAEIKDCLSAEGLRADVQLAL